MELMGLGSQMQLQCTFWDMLIMWCGAHAPPSALLQQLPFYTLTATLSLAVILCLKATCTSLNNGVSLTFNTKMRLFLPVAALEITHCRETSIYIVHSWVSGKGIFHFDFHKMNSEFGAVTLRSSELNTRLEVRAVPLPALQLSFHIMLRKSLHLMLL